MSATSANEGGGGGGAGGPSPGSGSGSGSGRPGSSSSSSNPIFGGPRSNAGREESIGASTHTTPAAGSGAGTGIGTGTGTVTAASSTPTPASTTGSGGAGGAGGGAALLQSSTTDGGSTDPGVTLPRSLTEEQQQQQHPHQHASYPHPHPPGSSSGSTTQYPWSFSVPSPPGTAHSTASTVGGPFTHLHQHHGPPINGQQQQQQQGTHHHGHPPYYPGYNVSNTRPMTAPSSANTLAYYHGNPYGGLFSPATYTGAGFPQSFAPRLVPPPLPQQQQEQQQQQQPQQHHPQQGHLGLGGGVPGTAAASYRSRFASLPGQYFDTFGITGGLGGGGAGEDEFGTGIAGIHPGSTSSATAALSDPFLHSMTSMHAAGYPTTAAGPAAFPQYQHHQRPGTSYDPRSRHYEDITTAAAGGGGGGGAEFRLGASTSSSSHGRPTTADPSTRPDTATSTFSTASFNIPSHHPSLYNTTGSNTEYISGTGALGGSGGSTSKGEGDAVGGGGAGGGSVSNNAGGGGGGGSAGASSSTGDASGTGPSQQQQKYNFVPLPGQPKKRPRRRFEEVERLYDCNYPGCTKAYGTLNHLNAHVSMQKHGPKRLPAEFKEIRKAWRQRKKDQDAANNANGDDGANASRSPGKDKGSSAATLKDRPRTGGGLPPPGPSLATELRGPRIPGIDGTPPTSTHLPTTPTFNNVTGFSGYFSASPNGYGRPNTAPGQMAYHLGGAGGGSGVAPISAVNAVSASPMLGGLPPGYLGARKGSVTSVPPAFASIQEDAVGESTAGPPLSYDTPPSASAGVGSLVPGDLVGGGTEGIRNAGFYGGSNSQSGGGAMGVGHDNGSRPSTASSPFRYSVSYDSTPTNGHHHHQPQPQQDIHGAFADSLTGHHPHPQGYPVHEAHFPPASTAMSEQDSWSAEWKNLSQPAGQYNQTEIR